MAVDPTPAPDPGLGRGRGETRPGLLQQESLDAGAGELLTVSDVAARYRVRPSWVYAHQRELGAIRLGDGPKARLRFDGQTVAAALDRHRHAARRRAAKVVLRP